MSDHDTLPAPGAETVEREFDRPGTITLGGHTLEIVGSSRGGSGEFYDYAVRLTPEQIEALRPAAGAADGLAEVDAARYRWLRARDVDQIRLGGVFAGKTPDNVVLSEEDLDCAIDAAMVIEGFAAPQSSARLVADLEDVERLLDDALITAWSQVPRPKASRSAKAARQAVLDAVARLAAPAGAASGAVDLKATALDVAAAIRRAMGQHADANGDIADKLDDACDDAVDAALKVMADTAARGPEGVRVPAELLVASADATPGPWVAESCGGRGAWIKGSTGEWAALSCGDTDARADANGVLIAAAVNRLREEISEPARPSRAEGDGGRR